GQDFLLDAGRIAGRRYPALVHVDLVEFEMRLVQRHDVDSLSLNDSSEHRQGADAVAMMNLALTHRIVKLDLENVRRPHPALGRQRAAEHQRAFGEPGPAGEL